MSADQDTRILLVEDDPIDVRLVKKAFEQQKISNPIHSARDGVEALEMLRGEGGHQPLPRPFMILLDLNMPRMDGIEFLREIRGDPLLRDSIVFVLSTSDDDKDKAAAYGLNVAGYLLKQQVGEDFMNAIRMLDYYRISVRFPPGVGQPDPQT